MGERQDALLFDSLYTIQNNSHWSFHCALYFAPLFPVLVLALLFVVPKGWQAGLLTSWPSPPLPGSWIPHPFSPRTMTSSQLESGALVAPAYLPWSIT